MRISEKGREWRMPFYVNNLVLCGELEEDLRVIVERFVKVCKRTGLKVRTLEVTP